MSFFWLKRDFINKTIPYINRNQQIEAPISPSLVNFLSLSLSRKKKKKIAQMLTRFSNFDYFVSTLRWCTRNPNLSPTPLLLLRPPQCSHTSFSEALILLRFQILARIQKFTFQNCSLQVFSYQNIIIGAKDLDDEVEFVQVLVPEAVIIKYGR